MRNLPVHWSEGLFLRPQHFQAAERHGAEALGTSEHWDHEYNYGLRRLDYSPEAIANYQFEVGACQARMRDGTLVSIDEGGGLDREYSALFGHLNSGGGYGAGGTEGRPTAGAMEKKGELDRIWGELQPRLQRTLDAEVEAFNAEVERLGLVGIVIR